MSFAVKNVTNVNVSSCNKEEDNSTKYGQSSSTPCMCVCELVPIILLLTELLVNFSVFFISALSVNPLIVLN